VPVTKCHGGSDKMSPVLDKLLDKTLDNIIDKSKDTELDDGINEDDFLSLDELNDFLSMNESDLDSEATKETSKTSDLEEDKISDVIASSDHKNTQCPATDDELPDVDLDDEEDPEEELKREQRKAEIKERFRKAKLKNRVDELDDFDDGDDDFTYRPKKKTHTDSKKEKVKVRRVYAGGIKQ
ncbi:helix-turn-helix domain-containing protein, partial [Escherichia coli]